MSLDRTKQDISDFLVRGWGIDRPTEHSTHGYTIYAPDGSVYHSLELTLGECSYCEEEDECYGHEDYLLAQEQEAKKLSNLIDSIYVFDRETVLSDLLK